MSPDRPELSTMTDQNTHADESVVRHAPRITVRDEQPSGHYYDVDCSCGAIIGDWRMPLNDDWKGAWWRHFADALTAERDALRAVYDAAERHPNCGNRMCDGVCADDLDRAVRAARAVLASKDGA